MSIKTRMLLSSMVLVLLIVAITMLSFALMRTLNHSVATVAQEYTELQQIDQTQSALVSARVRLARNRPDPKQAGVHLEAARSVVQQFIASQAQQGTEYVAHHDDEAKEGEALLGQIGLALSDVQKLGDPVEPHLDRIVDRIDEVRESLRKMAVEANRLVSDAIGAAGRSIRIATVSLLSLCAIGGVLVGLFAVQQYRWFITPVQRLRDRARDALAQHDNQGPLVRKRTDLLGDLDESFTGLVHQIDHLYASMEERVVKKSRELVTSERLASVGYLAAGVAHEINNPLNSILGFSELTLRSLQREPVDAGNGEAIHSLEIIREETYRCRHIVEKLLSLVRKSDAAREAVDLGHVVREVASMLGMLKQFRGRQLTLQIPEGKPICVQAREAEMKQVILNLTINALEAVAPDRGEVSISVRQERDQAYVEVADNGRGMSAQTIDRIFEPFYTEKRGIEGSGTGLGLSIVHAIVQDHQGQITARSDGPGRGSRFTVCLPALHVEARHA